MDPYQALLFGKFPRAVATNSNSGQLRQWVVHSPGEFDLFVDRVLHERNAYASVSWRPIGGELHLDKVSVDFDTPQKPDWPVFDGEYPPTDEIVARMRNDPAVADAVLGEVLDDAQRLTERSLEDGIPVVAVFSGLGIHVHQMYREKLNPDKQIDTTARKYVGDLNLGSADTGFFGDVKRVLRIPNIERVYVESDGRRLIEQRPTGCWTIPLTAEELLEATPTSLLEMARGPRTPPLPNFSDRPEMKTQTDYVQDVGEMKETDQRKIDASVVTGNDDMLGFMLEEYLSMPCMYERIQQPEPEHFVRQNCAVLLFNIGFTPGEVTELFSRIGWRDWDRSITLYQLQQIYRKGYSDATCASIRKRGLCVFEADDEKKRCPTYGWKGGRAEWKRRNA